MKKPWVYVAWIRNHQLPKDDQDGECPAIIIIEASNETEAKEWGDLLYKEALSEDTAHSFLWSEVHTQSDPRYLSCSTLQKEVKVVDWCDTPRCVVGQRLPQNELY